MYNINPLTFIETLCFHLKYEMTSLYVPLGNTDISTLRSLRNSPILFFIKNKCRKMVPQVRSPHYLGHVGLVQRVVVIMTLHCTYTFCWLLVRVLGPPRQCPGVLQESATRLLARDASSNSDAGVLMRMCLGLLPWRAKRLLVATRSPYWSE